MAFSIFSDITKISKNVTYIEKALREVCGGEIIRWAIIGITDEFNKISFAYKKDAP